MKKDLIIKQYTNDNNKIDVNFDYENSTVWLTIKDISLLFDISIKSISKRVTEIFNQSSIVEYATLEYLEKVQIEGNRKIRRKIKILNQHVIEEIGKRYNIEKLNKFKNWVENELLENRQKTIIFDEKPYEIVTFIDDELQIDVNVDVENDTVWLSQSQMAELFLVTKENIRQHIKNILDDNELNDSVTKNFLVPAQDGKAYNTKLYNLDMIISVGYRVNSKRGILFRKWASAILKNHLTKGYSINERRGLICQENLLDLNNKVNYLISENNINKEEIKLLNTPEATFKNKLFYENKIFEGYSFVRKLLLSAKKEIIIIDGYITIEVLEMLDDIKVDIIIYTYPSATISKNDIKLFQRTHNLIINRMSNIHDRFIVVDDDVYAFGSSLKDIGKKITLVSKLETISKEMILNIEESKKVLI